MTGSVIGWVLPGPLRALWRVEVLEREVVLLGRFRKVRQALELRHLSSSDRLIVMRYVSSPWRRSSVSSGEEVVRVNHDFEGSGAGGAVPTWDVKRLWRVMKSE